MKKFLIVLFGLMIITQSFGGESKSQETNVQQKKDSGGIFDLRKFLRSMGFCPDEEPLLLTNGECVSCDYKPGKLENVDVLFGCERCPNLQKKDSDCIVKREEIDESKKSDGVGKKSDKGSSSKKYKYDLVNIMGVGDRLQMTIVDNATGQKKTISVGDVLDGYTLKSVSLKEFVLEKDGVVHTVNLEM